MSIFNDIDALITAESYMGYADTGAQVPYVVSRPLLIDDTDGRAVNGDLIARDDRFSVYCCGASVEASYNLALDTMRDLDGKRVGGTTLSTSMSYIGAQVEGHYETAVVVQLNQGGL